MSRLIFNAALKASAKKVDVVILTGGLGSTVDDRTREAVAAAFGRPLGVRRKALQILNRQVQSRGRKVTPLLTKQALIPSGATVLDNLVGTAAGFYVQEGAAHVFALPGVPREAREMMKLQVSPNSEKKIEGTRQYFSGHMHSIPWVCPETDIQQRLSPIISEIFGFALSLLASTKGVKVTLSCWRPRNQKSTKPQKPQIFFPEGDILIPKVRKALEPWLFSEGEQTMEEIVGQLCTSHKWSLALAESCTGGLIAHRLTEVPGSSTYLDRGVVTYSNKAKQELLGVSPAILRKYGAVSAQVAEAMAKGIRVKSRVALGVSVTGIAGPGGGSTRNPWGWSIWPLMGLAVARHNDASFGEIVQKSSFVLPKRPLI